MCFWQPRFQEVVFFQASWSLVDLSDMSIQFYVCYYHLSLQIKTSYSTVISRGRIYPTFLGSRYPAYQHFLLHHLPSSSGATRNTSVHTQISTTETITPLLYSRNLVPFYLDCICGFAPQNPSDRSLAAPLIS